MNKRIFRSMCLLILLTVLVFALLWGLVFSRQFGAQVKNSLKTLRATVIDERGDVLFDNRADSAELENHRDRPEVIAAIQNGAGESERYSRTLGDTTYYYAFRLGDGTILRLSLTSGSIAALLRAFLPVVAACLALAAGLAFVIGRRLTGRITAPINSIDLDAPALGDYEELLPLLKKIETQKRELSAQIAEIESRTATTVAITENMKEGVLLLDEGGRILLANESVTQLLDAGAAAGRDMIEACRDTVFLARARAALAGEKSEAVIGFGDRFYSVLFSPVRDGEAVSGAAVLFIDITERRMAEAQRKEFSANVSHELKTPLTTIGALAEMIADGTAREEDIRPFADKIRGQSGRLLAIIEDIIKLSAFDEGAVSKEFTRFHPYEVARTVIDSLREQAEERGLTMTLRGDPGLSMLANHRMIDELLYNLTDNAVKYNRDGGSVTLSLAREGQDAVLSVADTGIGIAGEHIDRIFERFYRVDKSRSRKTGGTGLGLSIAKHVAEFHGGSIALESEEGRGTTVTARIPQP